MLGLSKTNIPLGCVERRKFYFMTQYMLKPSLRLVRLRHANNNSNEASDEDEGTCTTTEWPISHDSADAGTVKHSRQVISERRADFACNLEMAWEKRQAQKGTYIYIAEAVQNTQVAS
jgi:hypothetical protein